MRSIDDIEEEEGLDRIEARLPRMSQGFTGRGAHWFEDRQSEERADLHRYNQRRSLYNYTERSARSGEESHLIITSSVTELTRQIEVVMPFFSAPY